MRSNCIYLAILSLLCCRILEAVRIPVFLTGLYTRSEAAAYCANTYLNGTLPEPSTNKELVQLIKRFRRTLELGPRRQKRCFWLDPHIPSDNLDDECVGPPGNQRSYYQANFESAFVKLLPGVQTIDNRCRRVVQGRTVSYEPRPGFDREVNVAVCFRRDLTGIAYYDFNNTVRVDNKFVCISEAETFCSYTFRDRAVILDFRSANQFCRSNGFELPDINNDTEIMQNHVPVKFLKGLWFKGRQTNAPVVRRRHFVSCIKKSCNALRPILLTASPTSSPTVPTISPSLSPTASPIPSFSPTLSPSRAPSTQPTSSPTTPNPTQSPDASPVPTSSPTTSPSESPSESPTTSPSESPSESPTTSPSESPTESPTTSPTQSPSESPTLSPSQSPSESPTSSPSLSPSESPTTSPSLSPTESPTTSPSQSPTESPTTSPSQSPTESPTTSPSQSPSESPTTSPSESPSVSPTASPSQSPSESPTISPSPLPSANPTTSPTTAWDAKLELCDTDPNNNCCHEYFYVAERLSDVDARQYCSDNGLGNLVSFHSDNEYRAIRDFVVETEIQSPPGLYGTLSAQWTNHENVVGTDVLIGLYRTTNTGAGASTLVFAWRDGSDVNPYRFCEWLLPSDYPWRFGEPDSNSRLCVEMNGCDDGAPCAVSDTIGRWQQIPCTQVNRFLCKATPQCSLPPQTCSIG